ncbi:MAG: SGNH/GDSL hydrolase family protein [Oscillospiraceae bacterium]|nr:SGNH/GDSL hydrolase family protein [Oscillospiraceae bacterium]
MKKIISVICAAAVISAACSSVSAENGSELVVLGDSIATGYGLEGYISGDNSSAADSFANRLSAGYDSYVNYAKDGQTSAELLEGISTDTEIQEAVLSADTVVISIGGNDFLQPMFAAAQMSVMSNKELINQLAEGNITMDQAMAETMTEYADEISESVINAAESVDINESIENISGIIGEITEMNPDCEIYVLTVYDPFEGAMGMETFSQTAEELLPVLNDGITGLAESLNIPVYTIDVYSAFKGRAVEYTNISDMDIHPNKAGHDVIYTLISEAVSSHKNADTEETAAKETVPEEEVSVEEAVPVSDVYEKVPPTGNTGAAASALTALAALSAAAYTCRKRTK